MVERLVANEKVVGSNLIARSKIYYMSDLSEKKCIPCEGNIPGFNINMKEDLSQKKHLTIIFFNKRA